MKDEILQSAILAVETYDYAFCKFISANDAGATGGHQAGFYMPKDTIPMMFDSPGKRGENKERFIKIKWQNDFETTSRFIYYGKGTRNEYRLTRFGRGFPFLTDDNVGDLLVLVYVGGDDYLGYVLSSDVDIDSFLVAFGLSPTSTNRLITRGKTLPEASLEFCFGEFINRLTVDFPPTVDLAKQARLCYNQAFNITSIKVRQAPDIHLLDWINTEYELFKRLENRRYHEIIQTPFGSVEELINIANTILNRRKSRAGKSLEHHLAAIFEDNQIIFDAQATTEGRKRPDFIFPSGVAYNDPSFNTDNLFFLGAKTTCKDRWRQILNEADRIRVKHLFTLQQGISSNQLEEMHRSNVQLVVPKSYFNAFPPAHRSKLLSLKDFVGQLRAAQS